MDKAIVYGSDPIEFVNANIVVPKVLRDDEGREYLIKAWEPSVKNRETVSVELKVFIMAPVNDEKTAKAIEKRNNPWKLPEVDKINERNLGELRKRRDETSQTTD